MTSRRSAIAEAPKTIDELGARLQHLVDGARERIALMRHAPFGDDARRRRGARRSAVILSVFSMTLPARPGSSVDTTPTLRMR